MAVNALIFCNFFFKKFINFSTMRNSMTQKSQIYENMAWSWKDFLPLCFNCFDKNSSVLFSKKNKISELFKQIKWKHLFPIFPNWHKNRFRRKYHQNLKQFFRTTFKKSAFTLVFFFLTLTMSKIYTENVFLLVLISKSWQPF